MFQTLFNFVRHQSSGNRILAFRVVTNVFQPLQHEKQRVYHRKPEDEQT